MCFSATASFSVATGSGIIGVLSLAKAPSWRTVPIASIPLIFATQQAIEGNLWLVLVREDSPQAASYLAKSFVFIALVIWPTFAPFAARLVEQDWMGRKIMALLLLGGMFTSGYAIFDMTLHPYLACPLQSSVSYSNGQEFSPLFGLAYGATTTLPFLLSSHTALRSFGAVVILGFVISAVLFSATQLSVWCFFAGASSIMLYLYIAKSSAAYRSFSGTSQ